MGDNWLDTFGIINQVLIPGSSIGMLLKEPLQKSWEKKDEPAPAPVAGEAENVVPSEEEQSQQRKMARLSKYFTSPTGVMDDPSTGKTGVFA